MNNIRSVLLEIYIIPTKLRLGGYNYIWFSTHIDLHVLCDTCVVLYYNISISFLKYDSFCFYIIKSALKIKLKRQKWNYFTRCQSVSGQWKAPGSAYKWNSDSMIFVRLDCVCIWSKAKLMLLKCNITFGFERKHRPP